MKKLPLNTAAGNVLFFVFMVIGLLGALTYAISKSGGEEISASDKLVRKDQISRLLSIAGVTAGAIQQMVIAGADPETLYSSIDLVKPDEAGFATAPHKSKLYHPYGGGLTYQASTGPVTDPATIATDIAIVPGAIIDDVGPTNVTKGDMVFVAKISSMTACEEINRTVRNDPVPPLFLEPLFTDLFDTHTAVPGVGASCFDCPGVTEVCVQSSDGTDWAYYKVLLPN